MTEGDKVSLREFLEQRLAAFEAALTDQVGDLRESVQGEIGDLREFIGKEGEDLREFIVIQLEGHEKVQHEWAKGIEARIIDHRDRIRSLEKQERWRWVGQAVTALAAIFGIRTGMD